MGSRVPSPADGTPGPAARASAGWFPQEPAALGKTLHDPALPRRYRKTQPVRILSPGAGNDASTEPKVRSTRGTSVRHEYLPNPSPCSRAEIESCRSR